MQKLELKQTKRYVSPGAEENLYKKRETRFGNVTLVDYIGGDGHNVRASLGGRDKRILGDASEREILENQVAIGEEESFNFTQLLFQIEGPIYLALRQIYDKTVSVNEASGRYSVMREKHYPTEPTSRAKIERMSVGIDDYNKISNLQQEARQLAEETYKQLQEKGLAREIARGVIGTNNETSYMWKIGFADYVRFSSRAKKHLQISHLPIGKVIEELDTIVEQAAPKSWRALHLKHAEVIPFDMPTDSEIVDGFLEGPSWESELTKRPVSDALEELMYTQLPHLELGGVQFTDYMGDEFSVAKAATTSYDKGTKRVNTKQGIVKTLAREDHTSPFEMPRIHGEAKSLTMVLRQVGRHRTTLWNTFMGLTPAGNERHMPAKETLCEQDMVNRQGRGAPLPDDVAQDVLQIMQNYQVQMTRLRGEAAALGAQEFELRSEVGVANYTRFSFQGDPHNLAHFIRLRDDAHAQLETQDFAQAIKKGLQAQSPVVADALFNYRIGAMKLTVPEQNYISEHGLVDPQIITPEFFTGTEFVQKKKGALQFTRAGTQFMQKLHRLQENVLQG